MIPIDMDEALRIAIERRDKRSVVALVRDVDHEQLAEWMMILANCPPRVMGEDVRESRRKAEAKL